MTTTAIPSSELLDRFTAIVGEKNAVRDPAEMAPLCGLRLLVLSFRTIRFVAKHSEFALHA